MENINYGGQYENEENTGVYACSFNDDTDAACVCGGT